MAWQTMRSPASLRKAVTPREIASAQAQTDRVARIWRVIVAGMLGELSDSLSLIEIQGLVARQGRGPLVPFLLVPWQTLFPDWWNAQLTEPTEQLIQTLAGAPSATTRQHLAFSREKMLALLVTAATTAIPEMVAQVLDSAVPVGIQGRLLTEASTLTPRQGQALTRWAESAAPEMLPGRMREILTEKAQVLREQRAQVISETLAQEVLNIGLEAPLRDAIARGEIQAGQVRRYWVTAEDEKVCVICAPIPDLNPDGVGVDEPFVTPQGQTTRPPAHPLCRCVEEVTRA